MVSSQRPPNKLSSSFFGYCDDCAVGGDGLCTPHENEIAEMGQRLASVVNRQLWKTDVLPEEGAPVTRERGFYIEKAAFKTAETLRNHLLQDDLVSKSEKEQLLALTPAQISRDPKLFNDWLGRAHKAENFAKVLKYSSFGGTYLPSVSELYGKLENIGLFGNLCACGELPNYIGKFSQLKIIIMSQIGLTCIPDSFGELANVEKVWLDQNELGALPETIGNLSSLTHLFLVKNYLRTLPRTIGNLKKLTHLDLSFNQVGEFPGSFWTLTSLKDLNLGHNGIDVLPELIGNVTSLERLDLSKNRLKTLPRSLVELSSLEFLDLRGNNFTITGQLRDIVNSLRKNVGQVLLDPEVETALQACDEGVKENDSKKPRLGL